MKNLANYVGLYSFGAVYQIIKSNTKKFC